MALWDRPTQHNAEAWRNGAIMEKRRDLEWAGTFPACARAGTCHDALQTVQGFHQPEKAGAHSASNNATASKLRKLLNSHRSDSHMVQRIVDNAHVEQVKDHLWCVGESCDVVERRVAVLQYENGAPSSETVKDRTVQYKKTHPTLSIALMSACLVKRYCTMGMRS